MGCVQKEIKKIHSKVDELTRNVKQLIQMHNGELKINLNVFKFPKYLQETLFALNSIGKGTAADVARVTGKARAVESSYLNQLTRQDVVSAFREGRRKYFEIKVKL